MSHLIPFSSSKPLCCLSPPYLHRFRISRVSFNIIPWDLDSLAGLFILALVVKNLPACAGDARDMGSISGLGRFPGEGCANPLQYSYLENSIDRGACQAIVHGVAKSRTQLNSHSGVTSPEGFLEVQVVKNSTLTSSPPPSDFAKGLIVTHTSL